MVLCMVVAGLCFGAHVVYSCASRESATFRMNTVVEIIRHRSTISFSFSHLTGWSRSAFSCREGDGVE